jgi:hypothetical protein
VATSLNNLAGLLSMKGEHDAAWELYQRALVSLFKHAYSISW